MGTTRKKGRRLFGSAILLLLAAVLVYNALFSFSYSVGPNYRNVSIDTRVNITHAKPEVLQVTITDPVTLNAGLTQLVECNSTVRDYNGWATITNVSAVLWDNASALYNSSDDNNDHYTNATCTSYGNDGLYISYFTCQFQILYYANPGSDWICNVTATDMDHVFNASVNNSNWLHNTTTINQLLALNVTPLIDYGDMAVGDTSAAEEANVTNFGNMDINISVKGYGQSENDGLSFVCAVGNISVENQKFSLTAGDDFQTQYLALGSAYQQIPSLTLLQQVNDSQQVINATYWRLYVPPNPFGQCNGTIIFQAEGAT